MLVHRNLAESRQKAQAMIMAGVVYAGGRRVEKAGQLIKTQEPLTVQARIPFVSRGGLKLEKALDYFSTPIAGKVAADLGASTGGFTDCFLQRGARKVYAVDVSTRQLDWRLKNDPRVICIEKNARHLRKEDFVETPSIVSMDLSFISVLKVLPAVRDFLGEGVLLSLLKPQFEAGKGRVGKKGVIRDPSLHEEVLSQLLKEAGQFGFVPLGLMRSPLLGQKGNREFFVCWTLMGEILSPEKIKVLVREVVYEED